jgi:hypothetical protein
MAVVEVEEVLPLVSGGLAAASGVIETSVAGVAPAEVDTGGKLRFRIGRREGGAPLGATGEGATGDAGRGGEASGAGPSNVEG